MGSKEKIGQLGRRRLQNGRMMNKCVCKGCGRECTAAPAAATCRPWRTANWHWRSFLVSLLSSEKLNLRIDTFFFCGKWKRLEHGRASCGYSSVCDSLCAHPSVRYVTCKGRAGHRERESISSCLCIGFSFSALILICNLLLLDKQRVWNRRSGQERQ